MGNVNSSCTRCIHKEMCKYIDMIPEIMKQYPFISGITCKHSSRSIESATKKMQKNAEESKEGGTMSTQVGAQSAASAGEDDSSNEVSISQNADGSDPEAVPEHQLQGSRTSSRSNNVVTKPVPDTAEKSNKDCNGKETKTAHGKGSEDAKNFAPPAGGNPEIYAISVDRMPGITQTVSGPLKNNGILTIADIYQTVETKPELLDKILDRKSRTALNGVLTALNLPALP